MMLAVAEDVEEEEVERRESARRVAGWSIRKIAREMLLGMSPSMVGWWWYCGTKV